MQAQRVYDWERNDVEPHDVGLLSRDDVMKLVGLASSILGIKPPSVRLVKASKAPCKAIPRSWSIEISDWGRNRVTILHEIAHLATIGAVMRGEDGHGPTFVATAMCLYASILGIDFEHLMSSALRFGIRVGQPVAPRVVRNFSDIEF
jgi:hypothetical protein